MSILITLDLISLGIGFLIGAMTMALIVHNTERK